MRAMETLKSSPTLKGNGWTVLFTVVLGSLSMFTNILSLMAPLVRTKLHHNTPKVLFFVPQRNLHRVRAGSVWCGGGGVCVCVCVCVCVSP